jgi:T5SS/PEP-CTERM-associated repeat protein
VVTVTGSGSQWNNSGFLYVGRFYSFGRLNVESGGVVNSRHAYIGWFDYTPGVATVHGSGSQWNNEGGLDVGSWGDGTLNVEAGGVVSNGSGFIGRWTGARGVALVTESGSQWNNSDGLYVGGDQGVPGGRGELTVQASGLVRVTNTLKVWETGTVNLDGGTIRAGRLDAAADTFHWTAGRLSVDYHVGDLVQAAGSLVVGNSIGTSVVAGDYTLNNGGALEIELASSGGVAGMDFDQLEITGAANLGGDLIVSLSDGFAPALGAEFAILSARSVGGSFTTKNFSAAALVSGLDWEVLYNANSVTLKVVEAELSADYNSDREVDAADFVVWRKTNGSQSGYEAWRADFGGTAGGESGVSANSAIPEPATLVLLSSFVALNLRRRRIAPRVLFPCRVSRRACR